MKIRAHHLLCMQGFQGYGYSEDFSKNMAKVIEILQNFPEHEIEIVAETDSICTCCPYNINGKCQESQGSFEHKVFGAGKNNVFAVQETKHSELRSDASKIEAYKNQRFLWRQIEASKTLGFALQKFFEFLRDLTDFRKFLSSPKSKILTANNRIISMDLKVIEKLDISPGSIFEAGEIFKITNEKLKTYFDVEDICGDCRWNEKCLWYLKKCEVSTELIS